MRALSFLAIWRILNERITYICVDKETEKKREILRRKHDNQHAFNHLSHILTRERHKALATN